MVSKAEDPESLLCCEAEMYNEASSKRKVPYRILLKLNNVSPQFLLSNVEWFCCSFVRDDSLLKDSQDSQAMEESEVSAFDDDAIHQI